MGRAQDARSGCKAILDSYKATYTNASLPTYLAEVSDAQPGRVGGRMGWVNKEVSEQLGFGANVFSRVLQPSITVTNKLIDNDQASDEQFAIRDALVDVAIGMARTAVSGAVLLPATVEDAEITSDDGIYSGFRLTFNLLTQGGRTP